MQNVIFISVKTLPTGFNQGKQKVFFYPELYSSLLFLPVSVCLSVCWAEDRSGIIIWCGGLSMTPQWSAVPYWVCHGGWWLKSQRNLWDVWWSVMLYVQKCVCVLLFCLHVYLCVRITRLYVQCVTFLQVHKALWNNMYQLKKKACRVKVTANVRAVRLNMWMFGVVFVPVCKLSGTGIVLRGFVYATMMMRIELLLGNTVKCVRLLSACTGCVWLLCCVCVWVSIILWASCRSL